MGKRRRRSKNAGRISIDTKTHIGTKIRRRKPQMDNKKDNEDHQRKLELRKKCKK
jgi:hypothetical protein